MNFSTLLQPKQWFGKKTPPTEQAQAEESAEQAATQAADEVKQASGTLDDVSFFVMPKTNGAMTAGSSAPTAAADETKRIGIMIVAGGGLILTAALALLVWYVFFTEPTATAPVATNVPEETGVDTPTNQQPVATSTAPVDDDEQDEVDMSEVVCGTAPWPESAATSTPSAAGDDAWACFGERLRASCLPARLTVETAAGTETTFVSRGAQSGRCLVEIEYPIGFLVYEDELKPYANTGLQCSQSMTGITGSLSDAEVAQQAYADALPLNLTTEHRCSGTAVTAWEESMSNEDSDAIAPGADTDDDGLTNLEEQTVYVTAMDTADTDGDGYDDGEEVANGYNPAGSGTLLESGLIAVFENNVYGYQLWHPESWNTQTQSDSQTVLLTAPTGGFIQAVVHDNDGGSSLAQWYATATGNEDSESTVAQNQHGFSYIVSEDNLTVYGMFADDPTTVLVLTYSPTNSRVEYRATLEMMIANVSL